MTRPAPRHPHRLVFLGTPEMAVEPLRALHAAGFEIALVVSRADAKRGRGGALVASPVKQAAVELGLPVTDRIDDVLDVGADLGVVVAYGRIIRPHVLDGLAMVNLHFSLLPRWRGAAPVERAILAGDRTTGVCVMAVEEGLDTGGIYAMAEVPIGPEQTAEELRRQLVDLGSTLLVDSLRSGLGEPVEQAGETTYAEKLTPADHHLDWTESAEALHRVVRLGEAWTTFRDRRLKIRSARLAAASTDGAPRPELAPGELAPPFVGTGSGLLELVEVQPEGKGRQAAGDWARGARPATGDRLGEPRP
ncbi:MAG: methionyl-tRNA formyltransferase [Acidimicrobiales bacterium]